MLGHLASAVSSFLLLYSSYSYQVSAFVVHNYYPGNTCCTSYTHSSLLVGATYDQSILDETQEQQTQTKTQQKKRILSPSSSISKSWLRRYEELKSFKEKNGHCNVSRHENAIGNWVQKQRSAYKLYQIEKLDSTSNSNNSNSNTNVKLTNSSNQSPLSEEQVQLLNNLDFIWNVHEWRYQSNLEQLERFYQKHGHINVPKQQPQNPELDDINNEEEIEYKTLYKWTCRQRDEYKKYLNGSNDHSLTNERRQSLEKLGFHIGMFSIGMMDGNDNDGDTNNSIRVIRTFQRTSWDGRYKELIEFQKKHGHCMVPTTSGTSANTSTRSESSEQYGQLSGWVQHQRAEKKKKIKGLKSRLTDDKERKLDDIGFIWSIQDKVWMDRLNELREFKKENGHVRVFTKDGSLGNWVMIQRLQYGLKQKGKKNTLSDERMEALNELEFEWDIHEASWEEKYNELKECMKENEIETSSTSRSSTGNSSSTTTYPQHLVVWIAVQRAEYKYKQQGLHSHLTNEREKKLNSINFDWKVDGDRKKQREAAWMRNFEMLKKYQNEHGTCRVPVRKEQAVEEKSFSHWVRDQRRYYKAISNGLDAPMTDERRKLLESIGFADDIVL